METQHHRFRFPTNDTAGGIVMNIFIAAFSLFLNGIGVYLTIHADIGCGPWDVFNNGLSNTFGIMYGTASIIVSFSVLAVDVVMREQIGIAMIIDAIVVGKTVDLFNYLDIVPVPKTVVGGVVMVVIGLFVLGYTQYFYMRASLGCGPRDTMTVGLARRFKKIPIGIVSVIIQSIVTFVGYLLGGKVGIGTLLFAFGAGPIMQLAFVTMHFDATGIKHQNIVETVKIIFRRKK